MNRRRGLGGKYDPFSKSDRRDEANQLLAVAKRIRWVLVVAFWLVAVWALVL